MQRLHPWLWAAVYLSVLAPTVCAQGCPLCKESASALGEGGQQALNTGILFLMVPVLLMFGMIFSFAVKRLRTERAPSNTIDT